MTSGDRPLPPVRAGMLIRVPIAVAYQAFVDPAVTTKFWFSRASGRLDASPQVEWFWDAYQASTVVDVLELVPPTQIHVEWGEPGDRTRVLWRFTPYETAFTYVSVEESGWSDPTVAQALDALAGFTTVLDGAKAWLEHGIRLNLVDDKFPKDLLLS